jgi:SPP1 family predicted phage head-tail adaptor
MIAAGCLRHRIVIQQNSGAVDAEFGSQTDVWTTVRGTWADISTVTGREVYALGPGFTAQVTHRITIRWTPQVIRSGMRVIYGGRMFVVQSVSDPDERRQQLNLMCLELNEGQ